MVYVIIDKGIQTDEVDFLLSTTKCCFMVRLSILLIRKLCNRGPVNCVICLRQVINSKVLLKYISLGIPNLNGGIQINNVS